MTSPHAWRHRFVILTAAAAVTFATLMTVASYATPDAGQHAAPPPPGELKGLPLVGRVSP